MLSDFTKVFLTGEIFMSDWKNINLLRETNIDISGGHYSEKYAEEHNLADKYMSRCFGENPSMWIPEQVEVILKGEEVLCRIRKIGNWYGSQTERFLTSAGTFISDDRGEFGGCLIIPNGEKLYGNFIQVFELDNKIYAIDSCNHACVGHIKIYMFSENLEPQEIYANLEEYNVLEWISFKAMCTDQNRLFVLVSGRVIFDYYNNSKEKSYLVEISDGKVINKLSFDIEFCWVYNMIIKSNHMILGMDKVVAVVDLATHDIKAYTPISIEAEMDIVKTRVL